MIDVRRAGSRALTEAPGRSTRHSFSFGAHYDPENTGFGALVAHNEELLLPGGGYPDHRHVDTEIVTWVLSGALRHRDDHGHEAVVRPGTVQRLSAGVGVVHSELAEGDEPVRFVQAWIRPDQPGGEPSYAVARADAAVGWTTLVGQGAATGVTLGARGVSLHLARLDEDHRTELPGAPRLHLFVLSGAVDLGGDLGGDLIDGDAARLVDEPGRPVRATAAGTRLLVWALP